MNRRGGRLSTIAAPVAVGAVLVTAAALAIGRPDIVGATDFFTSGRSTHEGAVATIEVLVWVLVLLLTLAVVAPGVGRSRDSAHRPRRPRRRARAVLAAGLLIFVGGAIHNRTASEPLCCGDISRASNLVR